MSSSSSAEASARVVTDDELRELLAARETAEKEKAEAVVETLGPGDCPVCGEDLVIAPLNAALVTFVRRKPLKCKSCGLQTPAVPTTVGWGLALVLAAALALGGMSAIFTAQRITEPGTQKVVFMVGALLFGGGLFLGYGVQGAGSKKLVVQRIVQRRRQWADRGKAGTKAGAAQDDAGWFQENLEAVVVAIILALIIRHFAMEAFVIPTGSMAPTLLGDHFNVTCSNCDYEFPTSKSQGQFTRGNTQDSLRIYCPLCTYKTDDVQVSSGDVFGGHKILVNKFIYEHRAPRRYEIIVFKFPEKPWRNYIKRLIGLPGETLVIRNGDVYADGTLARKPDSVQDSVWIPVHDAAYERKKGTPRWAPLDEEELPAVWTFDSDGADVLCKPQEVTGAPATWLAYKRQVFDSYGYNRNHVGRGSYPVADLRVRAIVTPTPGAIVRLAIQERSGGPGGDVERVVAARFVCGEGEQEFGVEVGGRLEQSVKVPGLKAGVPVELTLAYADDRARLQIDGETVLSWDDPYGPVKTAGSSVRLGAEGAEARFERVRVDRDLFYIPSSGRRGFDPSDRPVTIPRDAYFAMGDNSPNSEDGRVWGFVPKGNMIGRAFLVFWPIRPFEVKFIR